MRFNLLPWIDDSLKLSKSGLSTAYETSVIGIQILSLQKSGDDFPLPRCCQLFPNVSFYLFVFLDFSFVDLTGLNIITEYSADNDSFVQMILPANLLRPGSKYRFKLAVDDGSKEGVASVVVEVRTGPTSGSFSVQPTFVKALETVAMSG